MVGTEGQTHFTHGRVTITPHPPPPPLWCRTQLATSMLFINQKGRAQLPELHSQWSSVPVSQSCCSLHTQHNKMVGRKRRGEGGSQQPAHAHLFPTHSLLWNNHSTSSQDQFCLAMKGEKDETSPLTEKIFRQNSSVFVQKMPKIRVKVFKSDTEVYLCSHTQANIREGMSVSFKVSPYRVSLASTPLSFQGKHSYCFVCVFVCGSRLGLCYLSL